MRVGLFIPCYIDQFYPHVGQATVEVLERLGIEVDFPAAQTCCGQPMANSGCTDQAQPLARKFLDVFGSFEAIVCPSGSCVSMIRNHYEEYLKDNPVYHQVRSRTYELCEFLTDVMQVQSSDVQFPYRVGLHASCHGLRELRLDPCSERPGPQASKVRSLLQQIDGLELVELERPDECCGFGGMFAVQEEAVSVMMGKDRIDDHMRARAQIITATDVSCLMHLQGILRRQEKPLKVMHVAEILAGHKP